MSQTTLGREVMSQTTLGKQTAPARPSTWVAVCLRNAPFTVMHLALLTVFLVPVNTVALVLFAATYSMRLFGLTAGYHRYFAHRAFKTSRWFQFVLGWMGC